jgi:hypothetical protein
VTDEGLLLTASGASSEGNNVAKLLTFFGVPWRTLTTEEFFAQNGAGYEGSSKSRLVCSSDIFLRLIEDLERNPEYVRAWDNRVHSAFVYAGDDSEILRKLVWRLTRDDGAAIHETNSRAGDLVVSDRLNDFCGVMAGLRVAASKADLDTRLILNTPKGNTINIISLGYGATFLKLEYKGVALFLSTFREIIDIDAALTSQNFDVRHHFLSAVPLVLYVKWAFAETCWSAPETNACLVIDDPVLKPRHGFVNFQELLFLMKRHKFSTNIAFIPWNWRRSTPKVVRLFRENLENYSVSVHGCDHTRAEFGSFDRQRLYWKAQQALKRMNRHESITGIRHDRVMVFPQGIFSEAAMSALKRTDLIAAVNNDVICADSHSRAITVSDVWDIAVMRYSNFPIFTRRYPWEGIENFAFDALLGKPAIIVIHHDYCSDHCVRLINFIQRLNALQCAPTWRGLGEVVRRSCSQREVSPGEVEVEMYGTELRIKNCSEQPKRYLIRRRESEPSAIKEIRAESKQIAWESSEGHVDFEIEVNPGQSRTVSIRFHDLSGNGRYRENAGYKVKAMLRRYLCEMRDNYITTTKLRLADLMSR